MVGGGAWEGTQWGGWMTDMNWERMTHTEKSPVGCFRALEQEDSRGRKDRCHLIQTWAGEPGRWQPLAKISKVWGNNRPYITMGDLARE